MPIWIPALRLPRNWSVTFPDDFHISRPLSPPLAVSSSWRGGRTPSLLPETVSSRHFCLPATSPVILGVLPTWPPNTAVPQEAIVNPLLQFSSQKRLTWSITLNIINVIQLSNTDQLPSHRPEPQIHPYMQWTIWHSTSVLHLVCAMQSLSFQPSPPQAHVHSKLLPP